MAKDQQLAWFFQQLEKVDNISRIRIHSRLPVVIPARITDELIKIISTSSKKIILVTHINHSNEIDHALSNAIETLAHHKVTLLNQTVLLKGINDELSSQVQLSERLFEANILPYYLHLLDKVDGAHHFDVTEQQAQQLLRGMIKELPGFLVPKLVKELPNQASKSPIHY